MKTHKDYTEEEIKDYQDAVCATIMMPICKAVVAGKNKEWIVKCGIRPESQVRLLLAHQNPLIMRLDAEWCATDLSNELEYESFAKMIYSEYHVYIQDAVKRLIPDKETAGAKIKEHKRKEEEFAPELRRMLFGEI